MYKININIYLYILKMWVPQLRIFVKISYINNKTSCYLLTNEMAELKVTLGASSPSSGL